MKVFELAEALKLTVYAGSSGLQQEVEGGYVSDLLSDVMGNAKAGSVWVTLQTHQNVMAIASLKELAAVVVVQGFQPAADTIAYANAEGIALLGTQETTFDMAGQLYNLINIQ